MPDFELNERNPDLGEGRKGAARAALRATWAVPEDTFITEDIPLLLTRLSQVPATPDKPRRG